MLEEFLKEIKWEKVPLVVSSTFSVCLLLWDISWTIVQVTLEQRSGGGPDLLLCCWKSTYNNYSRTSAYSDPNSRVDPRTTRVRTAQVNICIVQGHVVPRSLVHWMPQAQMEGKMEHSLGTSRKECQPHCLKWFQKSKASLLEGSIKDFYPLRTKCDWETWFFHLRSGPSQENLEY